ncbi:MAG: GNAT family N-acetyltransferase [Thermonemataceae bacterium]
MRLHIEPLDEKSPVPFELLTLADPSKKQIDAYLSDSTCFVAKLASETVGVIVLAKINTTTLEIKNIAVKASEQRKGFGKCLLRYAEKVGITQGYKKLVIGKGNSSIGQLALYQKEGFEISSIEKDFFLHHYEHPIVENGILCKHKIILEKALKESR